MLGTASCGSSPRTMANITPGMTLTGWANPVRSWARKSVPLSSNARCRASRSPSWVGPAASISGVLTASGEAMMSLGVSTAPNGTV